MSENANSNAPAREHAVLCVLVDVELDPAALDGDAVAEVAHVVGQALASRTIASGVVARGYDVKVVPCSLAGLTGALERVAREVSP